MISFVLRAWSIVLVAVKRLFAERGLAFAAVIGLVVSVALTMSVPLYADAVHFRLLREAILGQDPPTNETPFSFRFRYVGARDGALELQDISSLDTYLSGPAAATLKLPHRTLIRHLKTDIFRLYWPDPDGGQATRLTWLSFATVTDLERHIHLKQGRLPAPAIANGEVEILIHERTANEYGIQVDETYPAQQRDTQITVRIAGIWTAISPRARFWSQPLEELALVPEETFANRISPHLEGEVYAGLWQLVVDGGDVHASDVAPLLDRIDALAELAATHLSSVALDDSPVEAIEVYQQDAAELTFLLLAFSIPIIGLLLAFIGLVAGLYVTQQRNQVVILRSRGATRSQVVGIAVLEGAILGVASLFLGSPVGMLICWLIGRTRSFLDFSAPPDLRVGLTPEALVVGVIAVALALAAQLFPTVGAASHTIVTYKQERARTLRPPWWQRIWLDGILLFPTGYGFYILDRQGSLAAEGGTAVKDIFGNPLLFLTPALGLFALSLFMVRVLPLAMAAIAWIASQTKSVGLLLAARQLSRAPAMFNAPLILLTLTLSLSAFTASLARTLDSHLLRREYYQAGSDLRLDERGMEVGSGGGGPPAGLAGVDSASSASQGEVDQGGPRWLFRSLDEHLTLPGVRTATRVGRYPAIVQSVRIPASGTFIGIDRMHFPEVAYWERGFANQPLGTMMNALAMEPDGVLLSREFMLQQGLAIGDPVTAIVNAHDSTTNLLLRIVGVFELFPTWYPDSGPLLVGNLDYLFLKAGNTMPYEVWLQTSADADQRRIVATVRGLTAYLDPLVDPDQVVTDGLNIIVTDWHSAPLDILAEQRHPQRQGLFGLLSVGFFASALLTILGFLLYALFSLRRRIVEFGVLRAVGLSLGQMAVLLAWELVSLIAIGMSAGTALGVWVSRWFIPYLQVGVDVTARFPPFMITIAWPAITRIYLVFGALFVVALCGLTVSLVRMKLFQAVKLGEST